MASTIRTDRSCTGIAGCIPADFPYRGCQVRSRREHPKRLYPALFGGITWADTSHHQLPTRAIVHGHDVQPRGDQLKALAILTSRRRRPTKSIGSIMYS